MRIVASKFFARPTGSCLLALNARPLSTSANLHTPASHDDNVIRPFQNDRHWLLLHGLPRTILQSDVARLVEHEVGVKAPFHVKLDYERFEPTGRAWLFFPNAADAPPPARFLRASISGFPITESRLYYHPDAYHARAEPGTGPDANITARGMDVLLKGLIRGIMPHNIVAIVKSLGFQMRMEDGKGAHVFEMDKKSPYSSAIVHLDSVDEAHRLVRAVHMTEFNNTQPTLVRATVIY